MRSIGSTAVSLAGFNVPVKLYLGAKDGEDDIKFERRSKSSKTKFKQQYVDAEGKILGVDAEAIYGVDTPNGFVEVPQNQIDAIKDAVKVKTLKFERIVDAKMVPVEAFKGFYYLKAMKGAEESYELLYRTLLETDTVGLTRYTPSSRQVMVCIAAVENVGLVARQMYFANELRAPDSKIVGPVGTKIDADELALCKQIVNTLVKTDLGLNEFKDEQIGKSKQLIDEVLDGNKLAAPAKVEEPKAASDRMAALEAALKEAKS